MRVRAPIPTPALLVFVLCLASGAASADKFLFQGEHAIRFSHNGVIKEVKEVLAQATGVAIVNRSTTGSALNTLELTRPFAEINATVMGNEPGTMGTEPVSGVDEIRFDGVRIFRINPPLAGPKGVPGVFKPIRDAAKNMTPLTLSTLPAAGTIRICASTGCPGSVAVNLSQADSGVAIGPGVGGKTLTTTGTFTVTGMSGTKVTVMGQPWTINTAMAKYRTKSNAIKTFTEMGTVYGPLSNTGTTLDLTPGGMGGTLQLVTATQTTCVGFCGSVNSPSGQIARLTLTFAPEPGLLLLLGTGAVGVALLGRKRIRRR